MSKGPISVKAIGDVGKYSTTSGLIDRFGVAFSLFSLYIIWGSTYLAIRVAIQGFPPFLMGGSRFLFAGGILYLFLRVRGAATPTRNEWLGAGAVGCLLLGVGNGGVAFAEQSVATGLAALMIATVPLWAALFAGLWGRWPNRMEALGLGIGFLGIVLLNLEGNLRANPLGAFVLILSSAGWAFGSIWSRRLTLPKGLMASAAEMLVGGMGLMIVGIIRRESVPAHVSGSAVLAIIYLVIFGSWVAFSAYSYLLRRVRPALATSYAYVNPVVAVLLGVSFAGEHLSIKEVIALVVILGGVALVVMGRESTKVTQAVNSDTTQGSEVRLRPIEAQDNSWLASFATEHWGSRCVIARGRAYQLDGIPGFVALQSKALVGLVTYVRKGSECEIVSLNSLERAKGIGTRLVQAVILQARSDGCSRVTLITTNDNLNALRFYQKRGFYLSAIYPSAVDSARAIKPEIPLTGENGIPIRDEIELTLDL